MKKLIINMENLDPKKVFEDTYHEDLVKLMDLEAGEYDDMEVKGMEINLEQMAEDIEASIAENEKVSDVADSLSDTADVLEASESDTISPTEAQLMAISANMGVAGTQSDASDLAPSMEGFRDKLVAIEQLRMKNQIANEGIVDSVKAIGEKLSGLIAGLFSLVTKLETRIKSVKSQIQALSTKKQKEVTVKVKNSVFLRSGEGKYVKGAEEYLSLLTETVAFYDGFSKAAIKSVNIFGDSYSRMFGTIGKKKDFETSAGLYKLYMESVKEVSKLPGMKKVAFKDSTDRKVYISKTLLGCAEVQAIVVDDVEVKEENMAELKAAVYNTNMSIGRWWGVNPDEEDKDYKITFKVNQQYLNDVLKQSEIALSIFKRFLNETYKANNKKLKSNIKVEYTNKIASFHNLVISHGLNNNNLYISYAKRYSQLLTTSSLDLIEKLVKDKAWDTEAAAA